MSQTTTASIQVANAPCSWGVLEFDLPGEALGYAQVLDEIRDTGYAGTELGDWGFMPTDPAALRRELQERRLELLGAFVPVAFAREPSHAEGEERAVKTARLMAEAAGTHPFIVLADENGKDATRTKLAGRIRPEHSLSRPQWETFSQGVNRVAEAVRRQTGLRTVFHHHCAGFVEAPWEIEQLMNSTDPKLVGLCFDTGHYTFGGGADAIQGLRQFRDRVWHVHFKDCSPALHEQSRASQWNYFDSLKHGIFCELGQGGIDFAAIAQELRQTNYRGWIVVEQDVLPGLGAPKEFARRNREFLRSCGL
ncbi:MAG: TIM barrel protein [Verrucomicrobia bacterium]|nr:TIM barrel protein [Verrucomicrobiota bacterium]